MPLTYLRDFSNHTEYLNYISNNPELPNVSLCDAVEHVHYNQWDFVTITPSEILVQPASGSVDIIVSASTNGTISNVGKSWLTLSSTTSATTSRYETLPFTSGETQFSLKYSTNTVNERSFVVEAKTEFASAQCHITQPSKTFVKILVNGIETSAMTVSARGGKYPIQIQSNDSWKKTGVLNNLSFEDGSRSGSSGTTEKTCVIPENTDTTFTKSYMLNIAAISDSSATCGLLVTQLAASSITPPVTGEVATMMPDVKVTENDGLHITFSISNGNTATLTSVTITFTYVTVDDEQQTKTGTANVSNVPPGNDSASVTVNIPHSKGAGVKVVGVDWQPKKV